MKDRRKRNIIIGTLCCLLVFMGVGYSLMQQMFEINGTASLTGKWSIYIESISLKSKSETAVSKAVSVNENKDGASFEVELLVPGDYVEYEFVVKNDGNKTNCITYPLIIPYSVTIKLFVYPTFKSTKVIIIGSKK